MSLFNGSKRWLTTTLILLMLLLGSSLTLAVDRLVNHTGESNLSINQVRLRVNPIMLAIERNYHQLNTPEIQENIRSMAREQGIQLSLAGLDGTIRLSSNPSSEGQHIHL